MSLTQGHNQIFAKSVMHRTYCRDIQQEDGSWRKEALDEPFRRCIRAFKEYYPGAIKVLPYFSERPNWEEEWYNRMVQGKALPAGRMLWAMGSPAIDNDGFLPLMNCGFCVLDDPIEPIRFIAKMLMLGCGMGFSLEKKYFDKLTEKFVKDRYPIKQSCNPICRESRLGDTCYRVEDSREGWVNFLVYIMINAILMRPVLYNLESIRPAGSRIKGFGGRSGDPKLLGSIAERIYKLVTSKRYPDIEMYYDVICSIGELVISGNVRRSALIAIGDPDDKLFLRLKKFENLTKNPWRCNCNNSVNVKSYEQLNDDFWATFDGTSEAYGFVNVEKCQNYHLSKVYRYPPEGFNPCGEQPLADHEVCCLGEVNLSRAENIDDLFESVAMVYLFCKLAYTLGCSEAKTEMIVKHNSRIGISLTGLAMVLPEKRQWAYTIDCMLRDLDKECSDLLDLVRSIALTTVKPGGTLPKIAGSSGPGIHRPISEYQIRRVRFRKDCKLLPWLESKGVLVEPQYQFDGSVDPSGTQVASFYLHNEVPADGHFSDWLITTEGFIDMFDLLEEVQTNWSDNAVSVTVYYDIAQLETLVKPTIKRSFDKLKTLSLLPYSGHNFPQAPEEPISRTRFTYHMSWYPTEIDDGSDIPLECDDTNNEEEVEDFGLCESRSQCSERG